MYQIEVVKDPLCLFRLTWISSRTFSLSPIPRNRREGSGGKTLLAIVSRPMNNNDMKQDLLLKIVREYQAALKPILGLRLKTMRLFGSQARGEAREGSDIDVLCLLDGIFDYGEMIRMTSEVTAALSLRYDVVISRTFATERDFQTRDLPFFMNVRKEGLPV